MTSEPLFADLARVDQILVPALSAIGIEWTPARTSSPPQDDYASPALRRAMRAFALTPFECDVLLLALAPELDDRYAAAFAALHRAPTLVRPSVGLVLRLLAARIGAATTAAITALAPEGPLFTNHLAQLLGEGPHATRTIALPASVWQTIALDRACGAFVAAPAAERRSALVLADDTIERVERAREFVAAQPNRSALVVVHGEFGRAALARALIAELGHEVIEVSGDLLREPPAVGELARDARWCGAAIVVTGGEPADLRRLCASTPVPIVAITESERVRDIVAAADRPVMELPIEPLDTLGRRRLWAHVVPELAGAELATVAARFRFGPSRMQATAAMARGYAAARQRMLTMADVAEASRGHHGKAGALARRLATGYRASDLVVGAATRRELALLETAAREGNRLFGPGGVGAHIRGAGGIVALFAGPPGTGKTLAAQIMATQLGLDLLRIDLSQVVNKYIGETEKHLDQVFREGEATGAILFFDEADSLFGKRTDVRDAHDRYANLETAFLLQRLESHSGVTILATNLRKNLDAAFLRRIHVIIDFDAPAVAERRLIWEKHLVMGHLGDDVDIEFLARFELAGGDIRNAVTAAILLASEARAEKLGMRHLVLGAWRELRKAGRLILSDDFGAWYREILEYLAVERAGPQAGSAVAERHATMSA
jgi:hypothetical protein